MSASASRITDESPAAPERSNGKPRIVATYDYQYERGQLAFQSVRREPGADGAKKDFRQRRPDGKGGWIWSTKGIRLVPYRLPELLAADLDRPVFIVEGEKDVDNLAAIEMIATTNPMGAGKWSKEFNEFLRDRHVVILPDNDEPGRKHAADVAKHLRGAAKEVYVVELPDLPAKGDVSDWLAIPGNDKVKLLELVDAEVRKQATAAPAPDGADDDNQVELAGLCNYITVQRDGGKPSVKVGITPASIANRLHQLTEGWPKRVGKLLFAAGVDGRPLWFEGTDELFAWIASKLPVPATGENALRWASGEGRVTMAQFAAFLAQTVEGFDAVEPFPHWPALPRTYYMHRPVEGGDGTALQNLLARFKPATLVDGDLLRAFFLSLGWGGEPGQRPGWLFTSEEGDAAGGRGVGKSKIVQLAARVWGGHIDASAQDPISDLVTRILSADGLDKRIVLFDNVKTLRFSCAELEALVTNDVISGKRLFRGEGRRPNSLTFCLTLNGASLSRDMAQRCVIVRMARPPHSADWESDAIDFIEANRWAIIGDIMAALQAEAPRLKRHSRWGAWESAVLARVADPSECQAVIAERQGEVDEDAADAEVVRAAFADELRKRGHEPGAEAVWIPSATVANIVNAATNDNRPTNKATAYLRTLSIPELRESRRGAGRGWTWRGSNAGAAESTPLGPECPEFTR